MKAAVHTRYGPPDVVKVMEVAKPIPKDNEILVKVFATTVNRTDAGFRSAEYFISRFWSGLFRPKHTILGCEFAGLVENIGSDVKTFKPGDKVFTFNDKTFGGHAEYITIPENSAVTLLPENLLFEEAAPLTEGSHYAWTAIKASKIKSGQNALVYGSTGAIGSAAVQLLKHLGAKVTAVCNTKNVELMKSLGADVIIDYQTNDFTKTETLFHFVLDAVGKSSFKQCKPLLTEKGIYISTELGKNGENILFALMSNFSGGKKVLFPIPTIDKAYLLFIKELVEAGKFKAVIDRTYNLNQIIEAYRYVESGQKTGNVIIQII